MKCTTNHEKTWLWNNTENNTCKTQVFLEHVSKLTPKWVPKVELISGKITIGVPWWLFFILNSKRVPNVLQKWPQRTKNCVKKGPEFTYKCKRVAQKLWNTTCFHGTADWANRWPRPGGLREAVSEQRPSGLRSAYNKKLCKLCLFLGENSKCCNRSVTFSNNAFLETVSILIWKNKILFQNSTASTEAFDVFSGLFDYDDQSKRI